MLILWSQQLRVEEGKKTTEAVKIPSFLDCTINAKATTVVYDNLNLKNVTGTLLIRDEAVNLNNLKILIFWWKYRFNRKCFNQRKNAKIQHELRFESREYC